MDKTGTKSNHLHLIQIISDYIELRSSEIKQQKCFIHVYSSCLSIIQHYVNPLIYALSHWIGLRENLQETMVFTIKYRAFL